MKFYLNVNGQTFPNQTNDVEVGRVLRGLVTSSPGTLLLRTDVLFQGDNAQNPTRPAPVMLTFNGSESYSIEGRRFRLFSTDSHLAPAPPNQIAFALNRVMVTSNNSGFNSVTPEGVLSEREVNLGQIGNVFGHPEGRNAIFNETAIVPVGVGIVNSDGELSQSAGEEGAYIYFIRIVTTGNATGMEYFYQRQPYWAGAFIPGRDGADDLGAGETYTSILQLSSSNFFERASFSLRNLIPTTSSPTPSQIPIRVGYPTDASSSVSVFVAVGGMAFDEVSRIWWVTRDSVDNGNANASRGRSLWCWKRFTGETPERKDAADLLEDNTATGYPTLGTTVQYRGLQAARGGFLFIAADGTDASNNGTAETGALIQIDANTDMVVNTHGTSVTGIYTLGGLRSNDILEVAVDSSESFAAAGFDRIWVLHRNGLSFGDMDITTGAIASWSTVSDAGATFNVLAAGSVRGVRGNDTLDGASNDDQQYSTLDVDSDGSVYWISTQSTQPDLSVNRLNRLIGDASAHEFYSLDTVAEGSAEGFIELGLNNGTTFQCTCLRVFRRDVNDSRPDDIWLSGISSSANTAPTIRRFEASDWGTGNNLGAGYYQAELSFNGTTRPTNLYLAPDGSVIVNNGINDNGAILTSLGERTPPNGSGVGVDFLAPVGNDQTVNLDGASSFDTRWVQRQIRITNTTNPQNAGSFKILAVNSATQIVIENASGVSETSAFDWSLKGDEFETRSSPSAGAGTLSMTNSEVYLYDLFPDDSGIMHLNYPQESFSINQWSMNTPFQITSSYSGGNWYRSVRLNPDHGDVKTGHTTADELDSGVTVAFANSGAGGDEFVADEFYTFGANKGLIKDPTQELSYSYYGFFPCSSTLIDVTETKTASRHTAVGGFISNSLQSGVLTEDPFVLTTNQQEQATLYQRQFVLDGSVPNSETLDPSGTIDETNGATYALDLGSDDVVSQLKFFLGGTGPSAGDNVQFDLYSATDAAGPTSWTLRRTFITTDDNPNVYLQTNPYRLAAIQNTTDDHEWIFDFGELAAAADPQFGANTAARYWKIFVRTVVGGSFPGSSLGEFGNLTAFDAGGLPIGVGSDQRLSVTTDSDFLAVFPVSTVFLVDDNTSAGGSTSRGPAANQVTLNAGAFDADIGAGDIFRVLSGGNIVSSANVDTRDSGTQLTLLGNITDFTTSDWEVVRNVDVRPRDDQGGSEDDPALPPSGVGGALQLYLDPITGYIWYSDDDIANTRDIRFEKYIKVSRTL